MWSWAHLSSSTTSIYVRKPFWPTVKRYYVVFSLVKRFLIVVLLAATAAGVLLLGGDSDQRDTAFHVTLADPSQYDSGVYSEQIHLAGGNYSMLFVPNGDSPRTLSVSMEGPAVSFHYSYILEGTLHETGISEYHTWKYAGPYTLTVPYDQTVSIVVDPHGNTLGPVSVSLVKD